MKNIKTCFLCSLFAFSILVGCDSDNQNKAEDVVPDNPTISDSPRANQPSGFALPNAKGASDSTKLGDSMQ